MIFCTLSPVFASAQLSVTTVSMEDTIPTLAGVARVNDFQTTVGKSRTFKSANIPTSVKFNAGQLRAILANLDDNEMVVFQFVTLKAEDAERYSQLSEQDKKSIEGKLTLVVKGKAAMSNGRSTSGSVTLLGTVCPPPNGSCD